MRQAVQSKVQAKAAFEAEWKKRNPTLSFPYSGAKLPVPEDFHEELADSLTDKERNAHHLFAYLEKGYGGFT